MNYNKILSSTNDTKIYTKIIENFDQTAVLANIIIVHGLAEHSGHYDDLANFLKSDFNVIRYDQRGHGHSGGKRGVQLSYEELIDDLDTVVTFVKNQLKNLPIFVLGHSMGGFASALYGSYYPGKVDGFITTGAATRDKAGLFADFPEGIDPEQLSPSELIKGISTNEFVIREYELDDLNLKEFSAGTAYASQEGIKYLKENPDKFVDPVLIIQGNADKLVDPADAIEFYQEVASDDKTLLILSGVEHEILNDPDNKEKTYKIITNWIKERAKV